MIPREWPHFLPQLSPSAQTPPTFFSEIIAILFLSFSFFFFLFSIQIFDPYNNNNVNVYFIVGKKKIKKIYLYKKKGEVLGSKIMVRFSYFLKNF